MKIRNLEAKCYTIPLPSVLSDARHGFMHEFGLVTVEIETECGRRGMGYTYTVNAGQRAVWSHIEHDFKDVVIGMDARDIEAIWEKLHWRMHFQGRGGASSFAQAAVDIALWDLKAKAAEQPLYKVLGGHTDRVQAYIGGIDLLLPLDDLLVSTKERLDEGFKAIKMKVGHQDLSYDVQRAHAMRELLGDDIILCCDANMGLDTHHAIKASNAFADVNMYWFEEPTLPDDFFGMAKIARDGKSPLAAGENMHTVSEFATLMRMECVSFIQPDAATLGGLTPLMKVAHLAEAFNLPVTTHGIHQIHAHFLAAIPNSNLLEIHGFGLEKFMTKDPITYVDGDAVCSQDPGHGVEFDWQLLEEHRNH